MDEDNILVGVFNRNGEYEGIETYAEFRRGKFEYETDNVCLQSTDRYMINNYPYTFTLMLDDDGNPMNFDYELYQQRQENERINSIGKINKPFKITRHIYLSNENI